LLDRAYHEQKDEDEREITAERATPKQGVLEKFERLRRHKQQLHFTKMKWIKWSSNRKYSWARIVAVFIADPEKLCSA